MARGLLGDHGDPWSLARIRTLVLVHLVKMLVYGHALSFYSLCGNYAGGAVLV